MATEKDISSYLDTWAKLFKATTWEEIKMITKDNPSMNSTAESIYLSNADTNIIEQCRAREDAIAHEKYQTEQIAELKSQLENANATIAELQTKLKAYES